MSADAESVIANTWKHWSATRPRLIRPLTEGLTNRSYLLAAGDRRLVLRVNTSLAAELDLDRRAEEQALRLASDADLSAPLVYCDPGFRYLITMYLDGQRWNLENPASIGDLAALLVRVHRLPTIEAHLDIKSKVRRYWDSIATDSVFSNALQACHLKVQQHIKFAQRLNTGNTLTHNDLLEDNLIIDKQGKLYAIDWEYAATGDPFHDLAVICEAQLHDEVLRERLLIEYLQREPSDADRHRLFHWRVIHRYLNALWYAVQYSNTTHDSRVTQKEIGRQIRHLEELLLAAPPSART